MQHNTESAPALQAETPAAVVDKDGQPIRVGDVVEDRNNTGSGGIVTAVMGHTVVWREIGGEGNSNSASDIYVIARREDLARTSDRPDATKGAQRTDPDEIRVGDLVHIDGPTLAQVIARDGDGLIVAPLMDASTGEPMDSAKRWGWDATDNIDLVPLPVVPWARSLESEEGIPEYLTSDQWMDKRRQRESETRRKRAIQQQERTRPRPGDLVITPGAKLAQVITSDGDSVITRPLCWLNTGEEYDPTMRGETEGLHRLDCVIIPQPPKPVRTKADKHGRDWFNEFYTLLSLVRDALPPSHPVRFAFEEAKEEAGVDEMLSDPSICERLVRQFYSEVSEEDQRRVFKGWRPIVDRAPGDRVEHGMGQTPVRRFVNLVPDSSDGVFMHGEWECSDSIGPLEVRVYEATTKAEALAAIDKARHFIDEHFARIVETEPHLPRFNS